MLRQVTRNNNRKGPRNYPVRYSGRYIVADPHICHGKPTFRGTRIMVWQVLDQVANGMTREKIVAEWGGKISKAAVAEAVGLANRAFIEHAHEYLPERQVA